jgi:hypothetical protein
MGKLKVRRVTAAMVLLLSIITGQAWAEIRFGGGESSSNPASTRSRSSAPLGAFRVNRYAPDSLANPYGAGSPYKTDGLMNPYSRYGSPFSNQSWRNPYATEAPKLYEGGEYRGRWSANRFDTDSTSNPFGRYGSPNSPDSIRNPFGAGNPFGSRPIYVWPGK